MVNFQHSSSKTYRSVPYFLLVCKCSWHSILLVDLEGTFTPDFLTLHWIEHVFLIDPRLRGPNRWNSDGVVRGYRGDVEGYPTPIIEVFFRQLCCMWTDVVMKQNLPSVNLKPAAVSLNGRSFFYTSLAIQIFIFDYFIPLLHTYTYKNVYCHLNIFY